MLRYRGLLFGGHLVY